MGVDRPAIDHAGIVDEDIDLAAGFRRIFDQANRSGGAFKIGIDEDHANAGLRFERGAKALRFLRIAETVNDDGGALPRQCPCDRPPDAAG